MAISFGMLVRKIVGVLFLILAGMTVGTAVLQTGFDGSGLQAPPQGADLFRAVREPPSRGDFLAMAAITLAVGAVLSLIGVAFFGFRKWRPALGWTLAGSAAYGLVALLSFYSILNSPTFLEQMEARTPGSTRAFTQFSIDLVPGLLSGGLILLAGLALLWLEYSRKGRSRGRISRPGPAGIEESSAWSESPGKAATPAGNRPTSVTVISWYILVSCVLALGAGIWGIFDPFTQDLMKKTPIPIPVQYVMMFAGFLVSTLCGIEMLRGRGWARSFWVAWTGVSMVVGLVISPMPEFLISGAVLFLVVAFFLYRPKVSTYFRVAGAKTSGNGS